MENVYYLEKLSTAYFNEAVSSCFFKQADLLTNMAARVMYSTLPYNEQMNNIVALQSLLPGAKELFNYGMKALMDEIQFAADGNAAEKVVWDYSNGKILESLNKATKLFLNKKNWSDAYGGIAWVNITKNLLNLYKCIKNVEEAKKKGDWDTYEKQLREMVVYMNIIDGINHNGGSLLRNMVDLESEEHNVNTDEIEKLNYKKQLLRLMNSKELKNPNEVKKIVLPILNKNPDKLNPFKDSLWKIENIKNTNDLPVEKQLAIIDIKKRIFEKFKKVNDYIRIAKSLKSLEEKIKFITQIKKILLQVLDLFVLKGFSEYTEDINYLSKKFDLLFNYIYDEKSANEALYKLEDMYNKINSMFE